MTTIVNDYHVGYPDLDRLGAGFLAVLVRGGRGDLAVYSAIVRLPDPVLDEDGYREARANADQLVSARGNKESYERAKTFFPALKREEYRG